MWWMLFLSHARLLPCWRLRKCTQTSRVMRPFAGLRRWPAMANLVPKGIDVGKFMVTQLNHNSVWSVCLVCLWGSSADESKPRSTGIQLKFASAQFSHLLRYGPIYIYRQAERREPCALWVHRIERKVVLWLNKQSGYAFLWCFAGHQQEEEEEDCPCFGALGRYFGGAVFR